MARVEKTVFISYRRTNAPWALAIFQNLNSNGFDVFFDFKGIASGGFGGVIIGNIKARAHFLVLLTPSALERCNEPGDWLRREIETALNEKRNIVPMMLEGFDFSSPAIANQLTGKLAVLKSYNALSVPAAYFFEAMKRLRDEFLNVPLKAVLHPTPASVRQTTRKQQNAARIAPRVNPKVLTAQQWFERGLEAADTSEKVRCYTHAIRLESDYADAFFNRGIALRDKGDLDGATKDFTGAIRLKPKDAHAFVYRGLTRYDKGDPDGAITDFSQAIRLKRGYADAFVFRGAAFLAKGDTKKAFVDLSKAIRLKPRSAEAFMNRGVARAKRGDLKRALKDLNQSIGLKPKFEKAYYNRALIWKDLNDWQSAIADFQMYLDLSGLRHSDRKEVEQIIRDLKAKLRTN